MSGPVRSGAETLAPLAPEAEAFLGILFQVRLRRELRRNGVVATAPAGAAMSSTAAHYTDGNSTLAEPAEEASHGI